MKRSGTENSKVRAALKDRCYDSQKKNDLSKRCLKFIALYNRQNALEVCVRKKVNKNRPVKCYVCIPHYSHCIQDEEATMGVEKKCPQDVACSYKNRHFQLSYSPLPHNVTSKHFLY